MANDYKVHSYSHLIVKDLDKAYFLPYLRCSYCKGSRLYDDSKYMYFDYAKKDTKESDLMRPIRHLVTIGDAVPSLSRIKPDALQSNHWKKWLPVFPAAKVKSVEDGFANDIRFVLCKIHREKVVGDVLIRKQAFLDNINMHLKRTQNWHFSKGDSP